MTQWPAHKQDQSMGHYQHGELEFQWALAEAFTLCDHYHCSLHGGTNPNRLFLWTGTNGPTGDGVAAVVNEWDSLGDSKQGYTWKTYPERLEEAGITWKTFQNLPNNFDDNSLAGFRVYRAANEVYNSPDGFPWLPFVPAMDSRTPLYKGIANTMPTGGLLEDFARDVRLGLLPQVSWIVAPDTYSEHPGPSSPVQGVAYDPSQSAIALALSNPGSMPCRFHVVANAYEANTQNHLVAAGARAMVSFDLSKQGNGYDFTVTVEDLPDFSRRCAGRMENSEPGITDPCAIFQQ